MREWQDLYRQLVRLAKPLGLHVAEQAGEPNADGIHRALLAGLLSQHRAARRREDVERSRRRGRRARARAPGPPAAGRVRRRPQHALRGVPRLGAREEAAGRADERRARRDQPAVRPHERGDRPRLGRAARRAARQAQLQRTALGDAARARRSPTRRSRSSACRSCAKRRIQLARVDPALARELFIRHALVEEDWDTTRLDRRLFAFVRANRALRRELGEVEERTRRRDILAGDEAVVDVLRGAGAGGCLGHALVRTLVARRAPHDARAAHDAGGRPRRRRRSESIKDDGFPDRWRQGDQTLLAALPVRARAPTTTA